MGHDRVTKKELVTLIDHLNKLEGRPRAAYTRAGDGPWDANVGHYALETPHSGMSGYRLIEIVTTTGAERHVISSRVSGRELRMYLMGRIDAHNATVNGWIGEDN